MRSSFQLFCRAATGVGVLVALAACGQGDRAALPPVQVAAAPVPSTNVSTQEAYPEPPVPPTQVSAATTTPSPEPFDPDNPNTWPTTVEAPETQTAAAIRIQDRQDYDNMLATSAAEGASRFATQQASGEWPTPRPPQRSTPEPMQALPEGLFDDYEHCIDRYRTQKGEFSVHNCWYGARDEGKTRVDAGGYVERDTNDFQKATFEGGLYIYRFSDPETIVDESPFYETPNKEMADIVSVEGDVVTVRTDSALYTFDLASRNWSAPMPLPSTRGSTAGSTPTPLVASTNVSTPTSTPATTIFMPWVQ